jgi:uracil-DNA glycosylase family 4
VSLEERAKRERALGRAAQLVANCRKCEIGYTRTNPAYGEGDPCARLMLIGEGPGETEDRLGRPFVGRAGELLDKMMGAIGLAREEIYICNTVKCRPTFDDGVRLRNRAPTPDEMRNCRPYLDQQIDIVKPEVILCLGSPSAKSFLGDKFSITKQRGIWFEGPNGIPLIATFHPAYILRMTGGQDLAQVKRLVWSDLKKVRARLDEPKPKPPPDVIQEALF